MQHVRLEDLRERAFVGKEELEVVDNYRSIHRSLRDVLSDCAPRPLLTNVRRMLGVTPAVNYTISAG